MDSTLLECHYCSVHKINAKKNETAQKKRDKAVRCLQENQHVLQTASPHLQIRTVALPCEVGS